MEAVLIFKHVIFTRNAIGILEDDSQMAWILVNDVISNLDVVSTGLAENGSGRSKKGGLVTWT